MRNRQRETKYKTIDIIEAVGVSLPEALGTALFEQAKTFIERYVKTGQSLSDLINQLNDAHIDFKRAIETENNQILPDGLRFRNYWYRFGHNTQEVALLQCVIRTLAEREWH